MSVPAEECMAMWATLKKLLESDDDQDKARLEMLRAIVNQPRPGGRQPCDPFREGNN
jgi:hypothetical protein